MRIDLWNILEPVEVDPRVKSWKDVLRNLVFHANENGVAWPSVETIRREVGYKSRKAVITALAFLEANRMISVCKSVGRGTPHSYHLNVNEFTVKALTGEANNVDNSVDNSGKGELTSPLEIGKGEPTSRKGEVTSRKGEVTSRKGEVTSTINNKEISKNTPSPSIGRKGELTSPFVDNSAEEGLAPQQTTRTEVAASPRNDAARVPPVVSLSLFGVETPEVDYLALCKRPGWKPNDPAQTPPCDFQRAKNAVIACALRAKLSPDKAKEFWHYNAIRKWNAIDCGNTIAELAHAFCQKWRETSPSEYLEEQTRRREAGSGRTLS